ncbi:hypothetical protein [Komagataeibacter sp. FNDCR2]|uniref:hypothetical protein n=1 Tax=Komagataeibacter sp. FNDCR2 TaxID=2878682 RepID=UPI001E5D5261|nr:hypothetical protein [Komagataeibacter sp. FNDCR2]MCE2576294.1 hypothetical protein [Komagataeibacter sp. FNDCR2]
MEKQGSRALLAAVIGMGVLLFIGSLGLVGVLVHRMMHPQATQQAATAHLAAPVAVTAGAGGYGDLTLDEPSGTRIESVAVRPDGMVVAVLAGGDRAGRIIIWDPAGQRVVARLVLAP